MDTAFGIIAILLQILQIIDFITRIVATFTGSSTE